jgi:hypothetical protein
LLKTGEQSVVIEYPLIIFFILERVILFLLFVYLLLSSDLFYYLVETDFMALLLVPVVTYSGLRTLMFRRNKLILRTKAKQVYIGELIKFRPASPRAPPLRMFARKAYIGSDVR